MGFGYGLVFKSYFCVAGFAVNSGKFYASDKHWKFSPCFEHKIPIFIPISSTPHRYFLLFLPVSNFVILFFVITRKWEPYNWSCWWRWPPHKARYRINYQLGNKTVTSTYWLQLELQEVDEYDKRRFSLWVKPLESLVPIEDFCGLHGSQILLSWSISSRDDLLIQYWVYTRLTESIFWSLCDPECRLEKIAVCGLITSFGSTALCT